MKRVLPLLGLLLVSVAAWATTRTLTDEITSSDGGPVAFPGGIDLEEDSAIAVSHLSYFSSGATYVAVPGLTTNLDSVTDVTPDLRYVVQGNYVHVWGRVGLNPTAGTTLTTFTLTTPIVRSANFSGTSGATGTAGIPTTVKNGVCSATNGAKTVSCTYESVSTSEDLVNVVFTYALTGN